MGVQSSRLRWHRNPTTTSGYVPIPDDDGNNLHLDIADTKASLDNLIPEVPTDEDDQFSNYFLATGDYGEVIRIADAKESSESTSIDSYADDNDGRTTCVTTPEDHSEDGSTTDASESLGSVDSAPGTDSDQHSSPLSRLAGIDWGNTELDPLMAAFTENLTKSPLLRLPKNIIVRVIELLDVPSVECLKRVCANLATLCEKGQIQHLQYSDPELGWRLPGPFKWSRPALDENTTTQLYRLLDRDRYCNGCRNARKAPDWQQRVKNLLKYLYCSGCRIQHPACLFSMRERRSSESHRICIGHEGFLRLCNHDEGIIRWRRFRFLHEQLHFSAIDQSLNIICTHDSHVVSCGTIREKEHYGRNSFIPSLRPISCGSRPAHRTCNDCTRPLLCAVQNYGGVSSTVMRWTAHMDVEDEETPVTRQYLIERLAELSRFGGRFICPRISYGESVEARCFDPSDCNCIFMRGRHYKKRYKRHNEIAWLAAETHGHQEASDSDPNDRPLGSCHLRPSDHDSTRPFASPYKEFGMDKVAVHIRPCPTGRRCLTVDYRRQWKPENDTPNDVMGPEWFHSLDQDSYGLTSDTESFQICWCREEKCLNYYGYMRGFSRFLRHFDYRRGRQ